MSNNLNNKIQQNDKGFFLTNWSLKNKTSVIIITLLIIFFGVGSYISMPKDLFPELKMPTIYVRTVYPGNSPIDIENLITRPLEKQIKSVDGIKNLKSTSVQDNSAIFVEFNTDVDVEEALNDVKDAVDKAKKDLPSDLDMDPMVMDIDFSEFPIMNINISGDYSLDDLKKYAEDLQDELENLDEIKRVDLKGALKREINIIVDLPRMEAMELTFNDIENAVKFENMTISGGDILLGENRRNIRVVGEFKNVSDIENIIVKHEMEKIVYLRDIAKVVDGYEEPKSFARLDGLPVVSLDVIKKSGENLLEATDKINLLIAEFKKTRFPADLQVTITNDQSQNTRNQISNLENSIIMGVILVVLVLLFFIGLRNSMFVGIAIPLSMFMSFAILSVMGVSMNLVVLFSLILALGMLVDNAIVVVENVYRLYAEKGMSPMRAAWNGVGEIAVPIISSTATTLAAFFPLLFWKDLMGEFMKFLPMTLIIVLSASLFVALVVNPVFLANYIKKEDAEYKPNLQKTLKYFGIFLVSGLFFLIIGKASIGNLFFAFSILTFINTYGLRPASIWFQNKLLPRLENLYERTLRYWLTGKRPVLLIAVYLPLLMVFSFILLGVRAPKVLFFPENEPKYINVFIEAPIGTDIVATDSIVKKIENQIFQLTKDYKDIISSIVSNVGEGSNDPNEGPSQGNTPNKARITISFVEFNKRNGKKSSDVMKMLSENVKDYPGIRISVDKNNEGPPVGKPINLEIIGEDFDKLLYLTDDIQRKIEAENIPGIEGLKIDLEVSKPEMIVSIDREKARMFGLSTAQIGTALRNALFGKEISKFKDGEEEHPIQLRLDDYYRYNIAALMNQKITFRDPTNGRISQVPISSVATFYNSNTYGSVKRKDLDRVITISSNVLEGYNATEINNKLKEILASYPMPEGYSYKFTGEQEEQAKSMAFLTNALLIAVALITLILVSQFNSVIKPFIIMISVFFSTIGVFLGLSIFNMEFVIMMTGIGIVSLAGIVVNNAIVLIDYTDLVRKCKREEKNMDDDDILPLEEAKEAIVEAGKTRLRPVLLTAITTVLGLVPLATGMNIDFFGLFERFEPDFYTGGDNAIFWGPMSWTVIFGLTFATFLTLVAVPAMYLITDKINRRIRKWQGKTY
ncbi:MAG: efflux RND transporter permease subunit [Bacteroidia bacterium]